MKLAKVRHRIMASLVDFGVVASILLFIVVWKLPIIIGSFSSSEHVVTTKFVVDLFRWGIIYAFILLIYYVVMPLLLKGQTIGKKIFKLQVVREDDKKLDYKTMFYREAIGRVFINVSSLGLTSLISVIIMALRDDKKDLADILAKTKVVDLYESEE